MKKRRWTLLFLAATLLILCSIPLWRVPRTPSPFYLGRPLTHWAEQHPSEDYEAVRQLGTNALPFLFQELQARDALGPRLLQSAAGKLISIGEIFTRARHRRYYARLGLQVLDTNAVPALLDLLLSAPMKLEDSDPSWEAAFALSWIATPNAETLKVATLENALKSENPEVKRNACLGLAFALTQPPPVETSDAVLPLARHADSRLREAAMRYFAHVHNNGSIAIPCLLETLKDTNELVQQMAINALQVRKTNAASALPALLTLYSNTPGQASVKERNFREQLRR